MGSCRYDIQVTDGSPQGPWWWVPREKLMASLGPGASQAGHWLPSLHEPLPIPVDVLPLSALRNCGGLSSAQFL